MRRRRPGVSSQVLRRPATRARSIGPTCGSSGVSGLTTGLSSVPLHTLPSRLGSLLERR